MAIALASTSAILFGISNICFKLGITPFGELTVGKLASLAFLTDLLTSRWIVAGVLLTIVSGVFYVSAISYGEVAQVVAVLSLSYIATAILARVSNLNSKARGNSTAAFTAMSKTTQPTLINGLSTSRPILSDIPMEIKNSPSNRPRKG